MTVSIDQVPSIVFPPATPGSYKFVQMTDSSTNYMRFGKSKS